MYKIIVFIVSIGIGVCTLSYMCVTSREASLQQASLLQHPDDSILMQVSLSTYIVGYRRLSSVSVIVLVKILSKQNYKVYALVRWMLIR